MIQAATTKRIPASVYVTLSVRRYDLFKVFALGEGGQRPVSPRRGLTIQGMTKAGRDWLESKLFLFNIKSNVFTVEPVWPRDHLTNAGT